MVFKPSDAGARSFVLLAPNRRAVPARFHSVDVSPNRYQRLLGDMQRLRGRIYLEDGAIEPEHTGVMRLLKFVTFSFLRVVGDFEVSSKGLQLLIGGLQLLAPFPFAFPRKA